MKVKKNSNRRNIKHISVYFIVLFLCVGIVTSLFQKIVHAEAWRELIGSNTVYSSGTFWFGITDTGGNYTTLKVSLSLNGTKPTYSNYKKNSRTYTCTAEEQTTNWHSLRLNTTSVSTELSEGNYTALRLSFSYIQHAQYQYQRQEIGTSGGYIGSMSASGYSKSVVAADTWQTVEVYMHVNHTGAITFLSDADNKIYREHGDKLTLYYEKPVYTVSFNGNGNTGGSTANQSAYYGDNFSLWNGFTKDGHNFSHWTDQYGAVYYNGWTRVADQDMAFTANWAPWQHTVAYNANGGSGEPGDQTKTYGSILTLSGGIPSRAGYTFSHWWGDNGGIYYPNGEYGSDYNGGTVTLYAQWSANQYTVSYDPNGGSGTMAPDTATYDAAFSIRANEYTKTGYEFVGWNDRADGTGNDWTGWSGTWTSAGGLTVYAQWKAVNYTIQYDANGGTGSMRDQTAQYDIDLNLSAINFARPTYTFLGWSKDKDAATPSYTDSQSVKNIGSPNDTVILYAVWKKTDASFDTSTLIHDENMFTGDGKLVGGAGTTYDKNNVDSKYAHVDDPSDPGYFTRR